MKLHSLYFFTYLCRIVGLSIRTISVRGAIEPASIKFVLEAVSYKRNMFFVKLMVILATEPASELDNFNFYYSACA